MAIPTEIIESAKLDGANTWQMFLRIMLPMSKPAVATVGTLAFIGSWNDYIWPLMVLTDKSKFPIQVAITAINSTEPVYTNQVMAVDDIHHTIDSYLYCGSTLYFRRDWWFRNRY